MTRQLERILETSRPPHPPPELRHRTLHSASEAMNPPPVWDRWTRIWDSRPLRLVWAVTVIILIAANVLIPAGPKQSPATPPAYLFPYDRNSTDVELRGIASFERLDLNPRMLSEVIAATGPPRTTPRSNNSNTRGNI